jgi:hypothetical protein
MQKTSPRHLRAHRSGYCCIWHESKTNDYSESFSSLCSLGAPCFSLELEQCVGGVIRVSRSGWLFQKSRILAFYLWSVSCVCSGNVLELWRSPTIGAVSALCAKCGFASRQRQPRRGDQANVGQSYIGPGIRGNPA